MPSLASNKLCLQSIIIIIIKMSFWRHHLPCWCSQCIHVIEHTSPTISCKHDMSMTLWRLYIPRSLTDQHHAEVRCQRKLRERVGRFVLVFRCSSMGIMVIAVHQIIRSEPVPNIVMVYMNILHRNALWLHRNTSIYIYDLLASSSGMSWARSNFNTPCQDASSMFHWMYVPNVKAKRVRMTTTTMLTSSRPSSLLSWSVSSGHWGSSISCTASRNRTK